MHATFSNVQRECTIQVLLARSNGGKVHHGAKAEVARLFKCNQASISKIWTRYQSTSISGGEWKSRIKENSGRTRVTAAENDAPRRCPTIVGFPLIRNSLAIVKSYLKVQCFHHSQPEEVARSSQNRLMWFNSRKRNILVFPSVRQASFSR